MANPVLALSGMMAPWFAGAGAVLVGVPILIHILNRRRFKVVTWAAMEFLLRAMKKNRRRLRFEQMLLLATRCLLMLLIGLALSRPFGCSENGIADIVGRRTGLHVFVIDNSYSMSYEADRAGARTHLDQAKLIAKALIRRLSKGDEKVAIITASSPARQILAPTVQLDTAEAAVDRITQSWSGTDELGALQLAKQIGQSDANQPNKSLYLLDDSTRVAWIVKDADGLKQAGRDLAGIYKVGITHFDLGLAHQWNQAVVDLYPAQPLVTNRFLADFVADVRSYGDAVSDPRLTLCIDDAVQSPAGVAVKAGVDPTYITRTMGGLSGGIHVLSAKIDGDDRLPVDNDRWRVFRVVSQLKMLIVEGERGVMGVGSSGAFLETALVGSNTTDTKSYLAPELISDLELGNKVFSDYRCICLCGVGQISEGQAGQLEQYVRHGGTLMVFMGDPVTAENYNATLYKHHLLPGPLTKRMNAASDQAYQFDFNPAMPLHPLLSDFRNQQNTGLDAVKIFSYWQVDLPKDSTAQHVLDFLPPSKDMPADPAITLQELGSGRVLFYATGADPEAAWTDFMSHKNFTSLMHALVLGTVRSGDDWLNIQVGQSVTIPPYVAVTDAPTLKDDKQISYPVVQITDPDPQSSYAGQPVYRSAPLDRPGIYTLWTGAELLKVAVNVPAMDQADVRTIGNDRVRDALGGISMDMEADSVPAPSAVAERGRDLGWTIMLIVFVLAGLECFMAMRFGHHRRK